MSLTPDMQNAVTVAASEASAQLNNHYMTLALLAQRFAGTTGNTVIIDGYTVQQADLDAIPSFSGIKLAQIAAAVYTLGVLNTTLQGGLSNLGQILIASGVV